MPLLGRGTTLRYLLPVVAATIAVLAAAGSASAAEPTGLPRGITDQARDTWMLWNIVLVMAIAVFVLVGGALLYALFRFRRRSEDDPLPAQTHGNTAIEALWVGIPVVIVLFLFTISFVVLLDVEADAEENDLTVDVDGFQWQWRFVYNLDDLGEGSAPEGASGQVQILGTPQDEPVLVLPAGEDIEFVLRSADVIHSFYIRDFNYKLDVVPGRINKFKVHLREDEVGEYIGQCAEFCGLDHALMRFRVQVVPRAQFDQFIADNATAAEPEGEESPDDSADEGDAG